MMIISRTPFRVSFVGGGTDLPSYFTRHQGAVMSMTVNKYVYITVNRRFDETLRLSYSRTEIVDTLDSVQHPLFREALRITGAVSGIETTSIADIPSGTGLGSSGSFTVGLLHALHAYQGHHKTAEELASEACHLEIDVLGEPVGKQDQYAAAYGGLRRYRFNGDGSVYVDPVICSPDTKRTLFDHLLFFYLGGSRDAREILENQSKQTGTKIEHLRRLRDLVDRFHAVLVGGSQLEELGDLLHENWMCKRELATNVSNSRVDDYYDRARGAGALGGKLLGAGHGGFLMLFCQPQRKAAVREAMRDLREVEFGFEPEGSKIIYVGS
jgi:D-glycero-alpha-D-manno-heptose-7-phosphate kinase